jgi:hypothetical protein
MTHCYVCLVEDGELLRDTCACTSAVVHADCLRQWVQKSRTSRCAMCGTEYDGVDVTPLPSSSSAWVVVAVHRVVSLTSLACLFWLATLIVSRRRREGCTLCTISDGAFFCLVMWMYAFLALRTRRAYD